MNPGTYVSVLSGLTSVNATELTARPLVVGGGEAAVKPEVRAREAFKANYKSVLE